MLPFLTPGKGLPFAKKRAENTSVCVLVGHVFCFERKAISCQNPIRRGVLKMVWYLKGSPCKRQSPGSIFCLIFSCSVRRSGSYVLSHRRLTMMVWYLLQANLLWHQTLPSCSADRPSVGSVACSWGICCEPKQGSPLGWAVQVDLSPMDLPRHCWKQTLIHLGWYG